MIIFFKHYYNSETPQLLTAVSPQHKSFSAAHLEMHILSSIAWTNTPIHLSIHYGVRPGLTKNSHFAPDLSRQQKTLISMPGLSLPLGLGSDALFRINLVQPPSDGTVPESLWRPILMISTKLKLMGLGVSQHVTEDISERSFPPHHRLKWLLHLTYLISIHKASLNRNHNELHRVLHHP